MAEHRTFLKRTATRAAIIGNLLLIVMIFSLYGPVGSVPARIRETTVKQVIDPTSAGYVANYSSLAQSVEDVRGFWTVPTVQSSSSQTAVLESVAIGSGDTIIQLGTSQVVSNGAVAYRAWYWAAPEGGGSPTTISQLNGKVGAGRVIGSDIRKGSGNIWTLTMVSGTRGNTPDSFQIQVTHTPGLPSAAWIVQPIQPGIPLANFGSITFSSENATIDGTQSKLDQLQNEKVTLVDTSAQCILADTGQIDASNHDNFLVSFIQATGPCSTQNTSNPPSANLLIPLIIGGAIIAGVVILVVTLVVVSTRKKHVPTSLPGWQNPGQPATAAAVRLCANCNSPLQQGGRFCDVCGKQVL